MGARKPLIGINLDYVPDGGRPPSFLNPAISQPCPGYSTYAHHALNLAYVESIEKAGGTPVLLPHALSSIHDYVALCDGFLFTGGRIDLHPKHYGEDLTSDTLYFDDTRATLDLALARAVLDADKPALGICAGQQLLNVVMGGSLYQHIPDHFSGLEHLEATRKHEFVHKVRIVEGSRLNGIVGATEIRVNSSHHMAVKTPGRGVIVNAHATDGVPEGIECTERKFVVGVQWHPEFFDGEHLALFRALVAAAS